MGCVEQILNIVESLWTSFLIFVQVSVECIERGELLAELRSCYSNLLNKVPRQIKSIHEEVLAQRALDRRLTEELMRFKSTIGILTG